MSKQTLSKNENKTNIVLLVLAFLAGVVITALVFPMVNGQKKTRNK